MMDWSHAIQAPDNAGSDGDESDGGSDVSLPDPSRSPVPDIVQRPLALSHLTVRALRVAYGNTTRVVYCIVDPRVPRRCFVFINIR
jgi:hypothetical protein